MAKKETLSLEPTSFCGVDNNYPVFSKECEFIEKRREKMEQSGGDGTLERTPTTENNLVGLCLSGGGIRSATFGLGFMQALYRYHILQRVDYLSTVSGGGYIGSCLTALMNSGPGKSEGCRRPMAMAPNHLWQSAHFPFTLPESGESEEKQYNDSTPKCPHWEDKGSAEKAPVRRLRYFSNYLTAEGNLLQKYLGPALAFIRGVLFNMLLILPFIILAASLLAAAYQIPVFKPGAIQFNTSIYALKAALVEERQAETDYEDFIFQQTTQFQLLDLNERIDIVQRNPLLRPKVNALNASIESAADTVRAQWWAMATIPLLALGLMMVFAFVFLILKPSKLKRRFNFSLCFSWLLFAGLSVSAIQVFGAAIVYWEHFGIPDKIAFVSLLTFLGPKLLKNGIPSTGEGEAQKAWVKIAVSILLMALTPLMLLYFTGYCVNFLLGGIHGGNATFTWPPIVWGFLFGLMLLAFTNRWFNINKISLHNFYRDRLCRAYVILNKGENFNPDQPFASIQPNDEIKLSDIYSDTKRTVGPYHLINANLNLKKKIPPEKSENFKDGIFRKGESFIFSKYWCGSSQTKYVRTAGYEQADPHLNLGTAMAISGAAANIGMGQGDIPTLRLLMGLLNIRLGYWALNPSQPDSWTSKVLFGKVPGAITAMCEWLGLYPLNGKFINLSDGGHFDNIGVYELLRRRCKYIIVADAEADQTMKFQALAYLIRLARIDFGIDIDIDISNLKLEADNAVSGQHCVVGTIVYPADGDADMETGYLFYCKSSLTGDEPAHLNEYRVKHPSFPHQTTADQWFDEQQFEAYRELGYHIGKESFSAVAEIDAQTNMEDLFIRIKEFWHPRSVAIEERFTRHAAELNRIIASIKGDEDLAFMDAQIYPEWETLMGGTSNPPRIDMWLPKKAASRRAGFYICNQMIQLMENVYLDLNLEELYLHPDNRGWMNLFMHWAWAGMFRVTWAICACTYGAKFQRFCERRLKLGDSQEVSADNLGILSQAQPDAEEKLASVSPQPMDKQTLCNVISQYLNPYEIMLASRHLVDHGDQLRSCYGFHLRIKNPIEKDTGIHFCFGFAFMTASNGNIYLDYFRIQDHLRRMGLGRRAMKALVSKIIQEQVSRTQTSGTDLRHIQDRALASIQLPPWIFKRPELSAEREKLQSLLDSVITEIGGDV